MMAITVRMAGADDVAAIVALNREVQALHAALAPDVFKADVSDADLARFFAQRLAGDDQVVLLAELDGEAGGYVWFEFQAKPATPFSHAMARAFVHHIAVLSTMRRQGIATALLEAVTEQARALGARQLALETWATNAAAREFFAARGFNAVRLALVRDVG